jgi:hypothetical protein
VGEALADFGLVGSIGDQQQADALGFASGEWPGDEDKAFVGEAWP